MTKKCSSNRHRPCQRNKHRPPGGYCGRLPFLSRIALFSVVLLVAVTTCHFSTATVDAFCRNPTGLLAPATNHHSPRHGQEKLLSLRDCDGLALRDSSSKRSTVACSSFSFSSSALGLFRPDWMRRAGRIEEKRKERRDMYESLRNRQDELGISRTIFSSKGIDVNDSAPQRYRVVSSNSNSNSNNNTSNENDNSDSDNDNGLAIYPFVPENDVEANDESNVLDWLHPGEIVTAVRKKKVADDNVAPLRMAVVAATAIYNVQHKIRTDILWIEHDKGGWSPSIVDGVTRLIPIDDDYDSADGRH